MFTDQLGETAHSILGMKLYNSGRLVHYLVKTHGRVFLRELGGPLRCPFTVASSPLPLNGHAALHASPQFQQLYLISHDRKAFTVNFDFASLADARAYSYKAPVVGATIKDVEPVLKEPEVFDLNVDIRTWSNVRIDLDGWLWRGSQRICWLPPRYRPIPKGIGMPAEFYVVGNRIIFATPDGLPMIIYVKDLNPYYYN